jgi:hypothetical protein
MAPFFQSGEALGDRRGGVEHHVLARVELQHRFRRHSRVVESFGTTIADAGSGGALAEALAAKIE